MSESEERKRSIWKSILTIITVLALIGTAYALRHNIYDTFNNLHHVNIWAVLLIIPLEALNYHAQTRMYQRLFRLLDEKVSYKFMYRASLELNFVNNIFPSGGVSGFSYFSVRMRSQKISTGKSSVVQLMKLALLFISFQILLVVGLLLLAIGGKANDVVILISASLVTLLIVFTSIIAYVIGSEERINGFFLYITRVINRILHLFRRKHPETLNIEKARATFTELHENYMVLRRRLNELKWPLFYGVLANMTEVMAIYVVYIAFGRLVNPGAVIIAYAIANFAGLVSVLPGGVGIYEGLMTATLAAGGVPAALSLPVTVMYRIVNFAVQIPVGYFFYQKALHAGTSEPALSGE